MVLNLSDGGNFTNAGTFTATNGVITMNGSSQTLGGASVITLDTLVIASGTTTLGGNVTTTSNDTIKSLATLKGSSYTLTTAGNFIDNGTFYTPSSSTVYFNKNGHQCIQGTSTPTFQNLTISALTTLGTSSSINIDGTVTVLPGGVMACTCTP